MGGFFKKCYDALDERYQIGDLVEFLKHKSVPIHHASFWYYFGGIALFLFVVQVVTGILLLMYYTPGGDTAYESVRFIVTQVRFGWLVRAIHSWSANLMIAAAFIHMFSVFFMRAYRKPREITWLTGFLLLALGMGFGFSGYLLPWNELAYFATKVGTDIVGQVPFIGKELSIILRGGDDVTPATLTRFFGIHVAILPAIFTVMLGIHLVAIQRQGMAEPLSWKGKPESEKKTITFFPEFMLHDAMLWLMVLGFLGMLAVYFPWELGLKADPLAPAPAGIKPEWYFMFMFQTLKLIPAHIGPLEGELVGILGFAFGGLAFALVPFWDKAARRGMKSKLITAIGVVILVYMAFMTVWGYWPAKGGQ